jgi:hypothetical protein
MLEEEANTLEGRADHRWWVTIIGGKPCL